MRMKITAHGSWSLIEHRLQNVRGWYSANLSRQAYWRNRAASSGRAKKTIASARRMPGRKTVRRSRSRRRISTKEHHKFQNPTIFSR
jgi:hypothetical protein